MHFWHLLNSRFVSSLSAVATLLLGAWFGLRPILTLPDAFSGKTHRQIETLGRLQLLHFTEVPTPEEHAQKFVGRVRNNSSSVVTSITGAISFYDEAKKLQDFYTERLEGVSLLKPGEEADFAIVRTIERGSSSKKAIKTEAPHVEMKFVDVDMADEKR